MATIFPKNDGFAKQEALNLLTELQAAHTTLLQAMSDLDVLSKGPLPTKERIIHARWNISRASLARRTVWSEVYVFLSIRPPKDTLSDLRQLHASDTALLRSSSNHVFSWKIEAVMHDWPGYCAASEAIRWKMKAAIGAEMRLLYPILRAERD